MLKRYFLVLITFISAFTFSQETPSSVHEVIDWNFKVEYTSCDEATLVLTVNQKDGWHIYAQKQPEGGVSQPTELIFTETSDYKLIGKAKEYGTKLHGGDYPERIFEGKRAIFKQKIKINTKKNFKIHLDYYYMACLEACFPPEGGIFDFSVNGKKECEDEAIVEPIEEPTEELSENIESRIGFQSYAERISPTEYELIIKPQATDGWLLSNDYKVDFKGNLSPIGEASNFEFTDSTINGTKSSIYASGVYTQKISVDTSKTLEDILGSIVFKGFDKEGKSFESLPTEIKISLSKAIDKAELTDTSKRSYWGIFWLAFGGGLFALLTPCVFPMIPMTVSFFTKGSENKRKGLFRGVMYGVFILIIYVLLSLPFHLIDTLDPNILNNIATNGPLNIFFFIMLFVFALSFLGAFEIVLPAKWTNKADSNSNLGGLIGIFFMALTLALVSFSCTGPILGSLLANASAAGGGAWNLTWGMAGFGFALGLPFALFAIFPSWLNALPSSGGWLNNVKVVLGFLELAFAFKFLSNADLSVQAHLLERELFIAIWVAIFAAMTLYLFGVYQTKHDSPITNGIGTFRLMTGVVTLIFTIYMIPGMFGAPVKLISAFPPPPSYSEIPYGIHGHAPNNLPEGAEFEHGLIVFHDYDVAKKYADKEKKPLMLDFTGLNCVNCRKMETNVWSAEEVHKVMNEEFVVVSLYIDEKIELEKPEISPYTGRKLITKGNKWSDMQTALYGSNTQPQYIALDKNGDMMNSDATYKSHGDPVLFEEWLTNAVEFYKTKTYFGEVVYK